MNGFRRLDERTVHQGHIWRVCVAQFEGPDGSSFQRDVVRSPGAVGVLPIRFDPEGHAIVTLVKQYRAAFDDEVIEVPAGMRDVDGEPPEETARRELAEEVGLEAGQIVPLGEIMPSPGMTDAITLLFLATDLREVGRAAHGPEEEHMQVLHLPLTDAVASVEDRTIRDAKTVTALLLAERRLRLPGTRG